jgi:hypothetical protein
MISQPEGKAPATIDVLEKIPDKLEYWRGLDQELD